MEDRDSTVADIPALLQRIAQLEAQVAEYQHMEARQQWLATFPEQNPNMVIETDLQGHPTYLNPEAQSRYPDLKMRGPNHPVLKGLRPIIASFVNHDQDYVGREVDTGDAVLEQKICYTHDGDLYRIRVYAHDITARKRAEEAIQELAKRIVVAQEEERQRISRELHDEAGQALTALKIGLELTMADVPAQAVALRQNLAEAIALTDTTRDRIRQLARGLRPPALDTMGLNLTLEDYCRTFAQRTQLAIQYDGCLLPPLTDAKRICLYRVLQEGLTNTAKHAQAQSVLVRLWTDETAVYLSIADDGVGFMLEAAALAASAGLGLLGMQERLELLDGRLDIISKPGQGTRIMAQLPLEHG